MVYIFPSIKNADKPFQAATFSKQMKTWLKKYRLTDHIDFRSHDYRHTIATDLYDSGAGLPTTREFVGHKDENMTKSTLTTVRQRSTDYNNNILRRITYETILY